MGMSLFHQRLVDSWIVGFQLDFMASTVETAVYRSVLNSQNLLLPVNTIPQ